MNAAAPRALGHRARAGRVLVPLVGIGTALVDWGLEPTAHRVAIVFAMAVVAWFTEVVHVSVTALLIPAALTLLGVCSAGEAFAPLGHPLLFLFVGGFFIAHAMSRHGLDRRVAAAIVGSRLVAGRPRRVHAAFIVAAVGLSAWISNTAATAILLPILLGALPKDDDADHAPLVLSVAYAASVGGLATLVGSPPNGITAQLLTERGIEIGFGEWFMLGAPTSIILGLMVWAVMAPRAGALGGGTLTLARPESAMNRGERVTALAFGLAVFGWSLPGVLKASGASFAPDVARHMSGGAVALAAALPLFVFRDGTDADEPVLPWREATKIDWGLIMLFAGGLALGKQMFETGLARAMGEGLVEISGVSGLWSLTALGIVFTIFFTEVCSNTASAGMLVPLVIAAAESLGVSPVPPALGVGLAASCAFMLPIATGPNAVAFGTGAVSMPRMAREGLLLNVLSCVLVFGIVRVMVPLMGW